MMEEQHSETINQCLSVSHQVPINVSEQVQKYTCLNSAVNQGKIELVESLLQAGAPVNCPWVCHRLQTPLHSSVRWGDPVIVKKLLAYGASVNAKYSGDTSLTLAACLRKVEIVDLLLQTEGLENCINDVRITHFHIACMRNQVNVAKKLLQQREDVNATVHCNSDYWPGFTPMHFAVEFQCIEAIEFLLSIGADISVKDARQLTPLHSAHVQGHEQILDMLLSTHDRIVSNPANSNGLSHFHIACTRNKTKIVEHFIEIGVDLDHSSLQRFPFSSDKSGLSFAIQYECVDVVKLLLKYNKRDIFSRQKDSQRIKDAYSTGNMEVVNLLIHHQSQLDHKIRNSKTNYLDILQYGRTQDLIFETPSDINLPITSTGCTMLHSAIVHKNEEVGQLLLNKGADYTIQDICGKTPLHLAFEHNMNELVDLMLRKHKRFFKNITDDNGLSHFHIACARNNVNAVKSLLKLGADVDSPVNVSATFWGGYTPLHFTAKFGCDKVAHILVKHGANYSAIDSSNLSAFDIAFMEANKTSNCGSYRFMKLILIVHSKRKDERFNDRGVSLLHLACMKVETRPYASTKSIDSYSTPLKELEKLLKIHAGNVNQAVHKMGTNWDGYTPLHFAAKRYDLEDHAKLLIKMGADILAQNAKGDTSMHLSMRSTIFDNMTFDSQDLRFLRLNHIGTEGFSIFHRACTVGNINLMRYFLEHGVNANRPSLAVGYGYEDNAPLFLVIRNSFNSKADAVALLLKYGANPNARDCKNNTPLHLARDFPHHPEIIDLLVSHGADLHARNIEFEKPLAKLFGDLRYIVWTGCVGDFVKHIELFFIIGAEIVDATNENGDTPFSRIRRLSRGPSDAQFSPGVINIVDILLRHTIKLKSIGFQMTEKNRELFTSLLNTYSIHLNFEENTFSQTCVNELKLMDQIRIDNYTTLYGMLLAGPNKLAVASQNRAFQEKIDLDDFCNKYPIYGPMLKSRSKQGQRRWSLLSECVRPLNFLTNTAMPRVCSDIILRYLDDLDLRNIIRCMKSSSMNS